MIDPNLISTVRVDQLPNDAISLTDIFPFETLDDETLKKATFQDLVNFININANALQYEIKQLFVDQEYIDNNIVAETGLGKNLLLGWRLATELDGLVTIGYGATYTNIGGYGGSKDAVLVEHSHNTVVFGSETDDDTNSLFNGISAGGISSRAFNQSSDAFDYELTTSAGAINSATTSTVGVLGINKNMQPYCVVLKIIKL